jgi:ABC-type multidrug transport system fused ATPase/permease subunit
LIAILITAGVQLIPRKWWPKWTNPFVPDENGQEIRHRSYVGVVVLLVLGISAAILQAINLSQSPHLEFHDIYVGISWFMLVLVVALSRPMYCPTWLLPFFFVAVVVDLSSIRSWTSASNLALALHICSSFCGLTSLFTVLCMQYRQASASSGPISKVWTKPSSLERSPEDGMSMWQFLTGAWVWPLMTLGKERPLQKEDIWGIRYEVQADQLATAFRGLHQSTIFRKLLRANAIDLTFQWLLAIAHTVFEFASPLLLHQFLYVLENPSYGKRPAAFYGLLLFAREVLWSQVSMLLLWYGRRSYEQTRGVLTMAVFEKTLSRKLILEVDEKEVKMAVGHRENGKTSEPTQSTAPGKKQVEANQNSTELNGNANGNESGNASRHQDTRKPKADDRSTRLKLFKDLLWGSGHLTVKPTGAASIGQVLHIVKSDIDDIAKRFQESYRLVRAPVGIVVAVWLIWRLLGPSCFLGILVLVISQLINAGIARLRIRYQKYAKRAKDDRIQSSSQFIGDIRHLRWFGWQNIWLQKVLATREHELNVRFVGSCLSLLTYTTTVVAGSLFPVIAFIAYTAIAKQKLCIDLIFPALQLFSSLDGRLRGLPDLVTNLLNAYVAMERIEDFNQEPDLEKSKAADRESSMPTMEVPLLEHCDFAWPGKSSPVLRDVSLTLPPGLTLVYGEIGSGKTGKSTPRSCDYC